jgi:hypothetical protein
MMDMGGNENNTNNSTKESESIAQMRFAYTNTEKSLLLAGKIFHQI